MLLSIIMAIICGYVSYDCFKSGRNRLGICMSIYTVFWVISIAAK